MRVSALLPAILAATFASAKPQTAKLWYQPVHASAIAPALLAEIKYDVAAPSTSEVTSFEAPDIPEGAALVRIGVYDPKTTQWLSSTSATSAENFSKGYSPQLILNVDRSGTVVGAACRGVRIDAGQTRDFGPQAVVVVASKGKQPDLNKPVVLSPEGKKVVEEEKTLFQKYWWVGVAVLLLISAGGGGEK